MKKYTVLSPQGGHTWNEKGLEKASSIRKVRNTWNPDGMTKMRTPEAPGNWGATCETGHTVNNLFPTSFNVITVRHYMEIVYTLLKDILLQLACT